VVSRPNAVQITKQVAVAEAEAVVTTTNISSATVKNFAAELGLV